MRAHRLLLALLLALPAVAGAGAADPVDSLPPGQRPPPGSDEDELWYAMDRAERELQQHPLLVRDPALNAYVRDVACRVSGDYCPDLRVYIVEQPWFNASMAPNGMMIVWTGALLRFRDEAELALVLGHEVAHFRQRHSLQQWRKSVRTSAFLGSFSLLTFGAGVGAAGQLAGLLGSATLFQFARGAEREADRLGFAAVVGEGYDPQAGVRLWTRMKAEEDARRYGKPIPVFATHPKTGERLADVAAAAAASGRSDGERGEAAYRAAIRPFHRRWLEGELSRRMYDTSIQVIGELRVQAEPELQATYAFFLGEAYRRRGGDGDAARAAALYAESLTLPGPPPEAYREAGMHLRAAGDPAAAAMLQRYLDLAPEAEDREFIRQYLAEMENRP